VREEPRRFLSDPETLLPKLSKSLPETTGELPIRFLSLTNSNTAVARANHSARHAILVGLRARKQRAYLMILQSGSVL